MQAVRQNTSEAVVAHRAKVLFLLPATRQVQCTDMDIEGSRLLENLGICGNFQDIFSVFMLLLYSGYDFVKISWQYLDSKAQSLSALVILGYYVTAETMIGAFVLPS